MTKVETKVGAAVRLSTPRGRPVFQAGPGSGSVQRGSNLPCESLSGVQAENNLGSCQEPQVERADQAVDPLCTPHWPLVSSSGVHIDVQCPRKACSGVPFGSAGVSCQASHGVGIVPADLRLFVPLRNPKLCVLLVRVGILTLLRCLFVRTQGVVLSNTRSTF